MNPLPTPDIDPKTTLHPAVMEAVAQIGVAAAVFASLLVWAVVALVARRRRGKQLPAIWFPTCAGAVGLVAQILLRTVPSSTESIAAIVFTLSTPLLLVAGIGVFLLPIALPLITMAIVMAIVYGIAARRRAKSGKPLVTEQEVSS